MDKMDPGRADREVGVPPGAEEDEMGGGGPKVGIMRIMGPSGPAMAESAVAAMMM